MSKKFKYKKICDQCGCRLVSNIDQVFGICDPCADAIAKGGVNTNLTKEQQEKNDLKCDYEKF